ncbi:MAG: MATE family efflux transporter [Spirochaetes bacterium]|jgi:putative MATE family efflux protein|nr:MATE family efflux transporter [Spirochaetota bacterium]
MLYTKDEFFLPRMLALATPILLQNLLSSSLNFIDVFMIGRLGEVSVAAVGSANQFFFIYLMLVFGLASGSAIFTAQYWGRKDIVNIRAIMGIGLTLTMGISFLFTSGTLVFPELIISLFSNDSAVVKLGGDYLRIISLSFLVMSLSISFSVVLRSTENVLYPMAASITGILLNTGLNYLLIFGHFGFPRLGVVGAAYATLISRCVEMIIVVSLTYLRQLPAAADLTDLFRFTSVQVKRYLGKAMPVVLQSVGWAGGYSVYTMIYGHISTESLAAFSIAGSVERICLIFFTGVGSACSIMVGNRIGAGEEERARDYAANFLFIGILISIVISITLFLLRHIIVGIYNLSDLSQVYMLGILMVMSAIMWAKACNIIFHMGIFKAGGDTLFSMFVDVGGVWLIGVPIALVAGFYFKLPVHLIVACLTIEELVKVSVGFKRFLSGHWLNNLVD